MWFGVSIIIVGVILLLQNLGLVAGGAWNIIWPALIILLGVSILARRDRRISFDDYRPAKRERKNKENSEN